MNKQIILPLLISLSFCNFSYAQDIPNSGFENWSTSSEKNPIGWSSTNWTAPMYGAPYTCTKTGDTVAGQYAMELTTITYLAETIDGFAFTGSWPDPFSYPLFGYPFTKRPATLKGYYKFSSTAGDSCAVLVYFTKWNNTTKQQDSIGFGIFYGQPNTAYTPFEINIDYSSSSAPDTAAIIILASSQSSFTTRGIAGNTLLVDELSYTFSSGVSEPIFPVNRVNVYPNPFSDKFRIEMKDRSGDVNAKIFDAYGKEIFSQWYQGEDPVIDLSGYSNGFYLLEIRTQDKCDYVRLIKQ